MSKTGLFLGIETVGTGTHPASWRRTDSGAEDLFTAGYWTAVISSAEELGFDAVFLSDSFGIQSGGAAVTRGRLDAVAIAARTAPLTSRIGLIPQVPVTHTEPFHASKAVTALDFASLGRAGWEVTVSTTDVEAKAFGRKAVQDQPSLWHEADEAIEVVTRLWDSWEDGAEIRDVPTGRFIDRDRLHYIDFAGDNFSVKGPSITPRSPQGQPIVTVRADTPESTEVAVRRADLIRFTAPDLPTAVARRTALRTAIATAGRDPDTVWILLDLPVHLEDSPEQALAAVHDLDTWTSAAGVGDRPLQGEADVARHESAQPVGSDSIRHVGTVAALDELLAAIARSAAADGVVLRPLALRGALHALAAQRRTATTTNDTAVGDAPPTGPVPAHRVPETLRDRLGLPRPLSRYAATGAAL
ncbi:LLM class flavin-dependent oxidoreductase [Nocardia fluminea]|uniref:LLM class flavin-dependent oxidoreductase n=1 Tax=Nocardia fluminea TaxID=134984 RepID=UPI00343C851F